MEGGISHRRLRGRDLKREKNERKLRGVAIVVVVAVVMIMIEVWTKKSSSYPSPSPTAGVE